MIRLIVLALVALPLFASNPEGVLVLSDVEARVPDGPQDAPGDCFTDCNQCDPCYWRCIEVPVTIPGKIWWTQGCTTRSLMGWAAGDTAWLRVRVLNAYDSPDHPELFRGTYVGEVTITTPEHRILYIDKRNQPTCAGRNRAVRRP